MNGKISAPIIIALVVMGFLIVGGLSFFAFRGGLGLDRPNSGSPTVSSSVAQPVSIFSGSAQGASGTVSASASNIFGQGTSMTDQSSNYPSSSPSRVPSSSTQASAGIAGWQTFSNTLWGLRMQVPADYSVAVEETNAFQMSVYVSSRKTQNLVFGFDVSYDTPSNQGIEQQLVQFEQQELGKEPLVSSRMYDGGLLTVSDQVPRYGFFLLHEGSDTSKIFYFYSPEDYFTSQEFAKTLSSFQVI